MIAFTHFACCAAHSGPIFHMVTHATDQGLTPMVAATALGVSGFSSILDTSGAGCWPIGSAPSPRWWSVSRSRPP